MVVSNPTPPTTRTKSGRESKEGEAEGGREIEPITKSSNREIEIERDDILYK